MCFKVCFWGIEFVYKIGVDLWGEDFGVIEVMGCVKKRVGEWEGEVEDVVDYGVEDGVMVGFIDVEVDGWCCGGV